MRDTLLRDTSSIIGHDSTCSWCDKFIVFQTLNTQCKPYISVTHKVLKSCRSKMITLVHDVCDGDGAFSLYRKTCWQSFYRTFPTGRDVEVPPRTKNVLNHPLPTKFWFPPTKSQFNPIKKIMLTLIFDFNWCSVFTKCCF